MNIPEDIKEVVNESYGDGLVQSQGLSVEAQKINEILAYLREKEKTSRATAHHLKQIHRTLTPADIMKAEEQYRLRGQLDNIGRQ